MMSIRISDGGTIGLARSILSDYEPRLKRAIKYSAIDTIRGIRAQIPRLLVERYDITKKTIREEMSIRLVSERQGMVQGMVVSGKRIPIMKFNVIPTAPPPQKGVPIAARQIVSSVVVRGQAVVGRPNRFVARMPGSGHTNIFRRTGEGKKIDQEFRPAIPELIREQSKIRPAIEREASERFQKSLTRLTIAELKKANERK